MLNIVLPEGQADQEERLSRMLNQYAESHKGFSYK